MVRKLRNIELNRLSVDEFKVSTKWPVVVILDQVRSMSNVGSIFRTSDAFNVEHLFLCGITPTPPHRDISKTAIGAELSVDWSHHERIEDLILKLKGEGWLIFGVEQTSSSSMLNEWEGNASQKVAIVFGHEIDGMSQEAIDLCDGFIEVPQFGTKHSINVAVCAGVVIWQVIQDYIKKEKS